jgi:hypothetical protein
MPENCTLLIEERGDHSRLIEPRIDGRRLCRGCSGNGIHRRCSTGLLDSTTYTLVLADWRRPDGDGIQLADRAPEAGDSTVIMSGSLFQLPQRHRAAPSHPNEADASR